MKNKWKSDFIILTDLVRTQTLQPDLSGALFMKRSGIKKRERKAEIAAIKNNKKLKKILLCRMSAQIIKFI